MCDRRAFVLLIMVVGGRCQEGISKVRLTPGCVSNYHRIFITRTVPTRDFKFFHESHAEDHHAEHTEVQKEEDTSSPQWRIVGGDTITIEEIPYQVLYGLYCGGSLIAPHWVITAAHCKDKDDFVLVGSTYRSRTLPYQICAHYIHPLWNTTKAHSHDFDYQLLQLEQPVPFGANAMPIAIGNVEDIRAGTMVSVSGWGHLKYKQSKMQNVLRRVFVPIIAQEECRNLPSGYYMNITGRMFCAGFLDGSKDSCQGDSGGPAVANGKLVGLVSFGVGCAQRLMPGVYSNIPVVRSWIRRVTALPL